MIVRFLAFIFGVIVVLYACKKETTVAIQTPYSLKIPSHFPDMIIPSDNPMTYEGVALGRKLFHDKILSGDQSMSCATCHSPEQSFSDPKQFSIGITGAVGPRNSMALINLGWQKFFFWDGRAKTLEQQILEPVPNPIEMHLQWKEAESRLNSSDEYKNMFLKAPLKFGYRISSKFQKNRFHPDIGYGKVTGKPSDIGKFKVPTLRNIALTAPYMHDGRFQTLDEVIEHYSTGIIMSPSIDPMIEFANQGGVQLDAFEKDLLKQFLMTLTDYEFINNPDFKAL